MVQPPNPENWDGNAPFDARFDPRTAISGVLDWWREAGIDSDFLDEPRKWIVPESEEEDEPRGPARLIAAVELEGPPPPPRLDGDMPETLAAFRQWWLEAPVLDDGRTGGRVAPQGPEGAALMVLVEQPEIEDANSLLSGPQGRLLDAILTAFGLSRETAYIASVLPRHMPAADWRALGERGLGDIVAHHVALARPQRLLTLGGHILPLIGHELPQRPAVLTRFNQGKNEIPMLATRDLSSMLHRPQAKAVLWKAWLEWTAQR
ncbi:uracil-DNA glycosylase family protein [Novosphingobium sp. 9]|uniref:uracil-DNA glycosylase family protein n=1 Tax=Novosphingobium sp. 9 TaxID=2025349 RepID=UPI0021B60B60|nr:hypothetical protein [Novosphingobium sp. 9]